MSAHDLYKEYARAAAAGGRASSVDHEEDLHIKPSEYRAKTVDVQILAHNVELLGLWNLDHQKTLRAQQDAIAPTPRCEKHKVVPVSRTFSFGAIPPARCVSFF